MPGDHSGAASAGRASAPHAAAGPPAAARCLVMGVLNVTPDSFSDGGRWLDADAAVGHGLDLIRQGADLVDVGGESTRPGAARVPVQEELRRIGPVIAGLADPRMASLVAAAGVPYVVTHWRGPSRDMQDKAVYGDVVAEVRDELRQQVDAVTGAGVDPQKIIVDPGLGFGKLAGHNWLLLAGLSEISCLGGTGSPFRVLVGASRKSFLGALLAAGDGTARPAAGRDDATIAISGLAAAAGAWCVRVHEVAGNADAVRVAQRWRQAAGSGQHAAGPQWRGPGPGEPG